MANVFDYLDWRGDIPFSVSPMNEIDNLIFCELCFMNFNGIVPSDVVEEGIPLRLASQLYSQLHAAEPPTMGLIVPADIPVLVKRMAETERFRHLLLRAYVDRIDEDLQKQFAALTIQISEDELYVAYRGTDDTIVGWKENFNMSFMQAVPAQLDAVDYLNRVAASTTHQKITVGGHSKGGNLAVYASIHCEESYKSRIVQVYSNDGPGYCREVVESDAYKDMESRIVNIIPQSSVVGRLLEHTDKYRVVQSKASGLWQHDGFSWEVMGTKFVEAPKLTAESQRIERLLKQWINEMDETQRQQLVDSIYRALTATNAKTLTDLTRDRNWLWHLLTDSELSDSRKTLMTGLKQLTGEARRIWVEGILPNKFKRTSPANEASDAEEAEEKPRPLPVRTSIPKESKKAKHKGVKTNTPQRSDKAPRHSIPIAKGAVVLSDKTIRVSSKTGRSSSSKKNNKE